jgi:hypothetical protein
MTFKLPSLYPPIERPGYPPTWEDIEQLARNYTEVRTACIMVERGELTREQALIMLVFTYADLFQRMFSAEVDRRNCETPPIYIIPERNGNPFA